MNNLNLLEADVIAFANSKGGVGKTNGAFQVISAVLTKYQKQFKIFEIDNNNISNLFDNSNILINNTKSVKTNDIEIAAEIVIETLTGTDTVVVDCGGGDDSRSAINIIKSLGEDINVIYLIPIDRNQNNYKNSVDTIKDIDTQNFIYVLNGYSNPDEFDFFDFNLPHVKIPFSNLFHYAQNLKYTVWDLASISQDLPKEAAKKLFIEKFTVDGVLNKLEFIQAFNNYQKSEKANELILQFFDSFEPFLSKKIKKK